MPRGYRCILIAVVGWLSLTAAQQPSHKTEKAQQTKQVEQPPPAYKPYAPLSKDPCYRAESHDAADLCAQWRAAFAAEKAAKAAHEAVTWTIVGTFLSAAALFALFMTLRQTERALAQAQRGNEISEKTAHRQLRAYVVISNMAIENIAQGENPDVTYDLINVGQTPAYEVRHMAKVFNASTVKDASWQKVFFGQPPLMSKSTLGPNTPGPGGFKAFTVGGMSPTIYEAIMAGQMVLGIFGAITYRDIYGRRHITTFKQMLPTERIKDGAGNLVACEKGNRAN
jgi:hypothetical protein